DDRHRRDRRRRQQPPARPSAATPPARPATPSVPRRRRVAAPPLRGAGTVGSRYDLALLAPRVLGANAHEIAPRPEETGAGEEPGAAARGTATERGVFWGALALAVAVLLGILARLLRDTGAPDKATGSGVGRPS